MSALGVEEKIDSLDLCLRLIGGQYPKWAFVSIPLPSKIPAIQRLKGGDIACCSSFYLRHKHNVDDEPLPVNTTFVFLKLNRFPLVSHLRYVPFSSPSTNLNSNLSSCVIGTTLYCLGSDTYNLDGLPNISSECPTSLDDHFPFKNSVITPEDSLPFDFAPGALGIHNRLWSIDLTNPASRWTEGSFLLCPRLHPVFVSFLGKLYAFGGNDPSFLPFAEVYDPVSDAWTPLPPPPFGRLAFFETYVVPLTASSKLWVFSMFREVDFTFHVLTEKWEKARDSDKLLPYFNKPSTRSSVKQSKLVSVLSRQKDLVVYWVNQLERVYAFNLSTSQLFCGTISGLENEFRYPLCLHHLYGDVFCLIGCDGPSDAVPWKTLLHVTLLQITLEPPPLSKYRPHFPTCHNLFGPEIDCPKPLTATLLACLAYPIKDRIHITDSYLLSNPIQVNKM